MIAGYSGLYINIMPGNYPDFKEEEASLQNEEALNARNKCVDINSLAFPRTRGVSPCLGKMGR